ncbi:MAG: type pilus assembly protein PilB [Solirubrobacteraceae bacterium]|jgi:type IV pilus assembly protein PilB|nr:type pilus assembly protein PilB [Solirubrobacteraceae bacterium]
MVPPPPSATAAAPQTDAAAHDGTNWRPRPGKLIGDVIVDQGFVARDAVEAAAVTGRENGKQLGQVLIDRGLMTPEQLGQAVAERFGLEYVELPGYNVDTVAASMVDGAVARRLEALPIGFGEGGELTVAMANPSNVLAVDDLAMMTGRSILPVVAAREDILAVIARVSSLDGAVLEAVQEEEAPTIEERVELRESAGDAPTVKLVRSIIAQAIDRGASDVHFDPESDGLQVRFRVDGVMLDAAQVPRRMVSSVISRIKILANLDIAERRMPQDGRIGLNIEGRHIDLRVVVLPLVDAESVVLRILDSGSAPLTLEDLGMLENDRERFSLSLGRAHGGILACGPTGAGKSSTLYAALMSISTREKTIITIEDPVEYRVDGIRQVQVNEKIGMTFAKGLRSMMRADPDILMVGEIRDTESAHIAIESALTGHLVLSTLHTNDAPSAVGRLTDMGIEPFLVASAIDCVVAQRLARKLCEKCRKPSETGEEGTFEPVGCTRCGGTGYKGRVGLFEVMTVTPEMHQLIVDRASVNAMTELALSQGMRSLREDGMAKVRAGVTSFAEVVRVVGTV